MTETSEIVGQGRTVIISFHIPRTMLTELDRLVKRGYFTSRSEAIRAALFFMIREIKHREEAKPKLLQPEAEVGYR